MPYASANRAPITIDQIKVFIERRLRSDGVARGPLFHMKRLIFVCCYADIRTIG